MEGYLRVILLGAAAIIVVFIGIESWYTRRRKYKLANLTENFNSPIQIDSDDTLDMDPREPKLNSDEYDSEIEGQHYYSADTTSSYERSSYPNTYAEDEADVVVVSRPQATTPTSAKPAQQDYTRDLLVLSVVAKSGQQFGSYDLLQSIYATDMEFGDMNIFHYYGTNNGKRIPLFSLASATEPGEFDLDKIGNYFCSGLTLFTQLDNVPDPQEAFTLMLKAAEQLAEDLHGELRAGPRKPWNEQTFKEYQQKALYFQAKIRP
jgi:cell division protein ZipA